MYVADPVITIEHKMVHEGKYFTLNYTELALVNDGYMRVRIKTNENTYFHFTIATVTGGDALFKSYVNSTYSNKGTPPDGSKLTKFNRSAVSTKVSGVEVTYNPTVTTFGTQRANTLFIGGTGGNAVGSTANDRLESIVGPNTDILFELQNKSGQAKNFGILIDWYEVVK